MSLRQGMPAGMDVPFREDFYNSMSVMDNGGVVAGSLAIDRGATFAGAGSILYNNFKRAPGQLGLFTVAIRFRNLVTWAGAVGYTPLLAWDDGTANNLFLIYVSATTVVILQTKATVSTSSAWTLTNPTAIGEHQLVLTRGVTAAGEAYLDSVALVAASLNLTANGPVVSRGMQVGANVGGAAPSNNIILRQILWFDGVKLSPEEVLDLWQQDTCQELVP